MAVSTAKLDRIDLRTNSEEKSILERASQINHLSLSSYIITTCLKQAKLDLEKEETITLSNKDRDLIMSALSNSPEPNDALKDLFK